MIEEVVHKWDLKDFSEIRENLAFWLSKTPAERVEAVERLRHQHYGEMGRMQKVARVYQDGKLIKVLRPRVSTKDVRQDQNV
jgi:hypothetical protein